MINFMQHDFNIDKIEIACHVTSETGKIVHQNRPNHGIAIHTGGKKEYIFPDKTVLVVKSNDIIYLPKFSNYTVYHTIPGNCYATNFDIKDTISFPPFVIKAKNHTKITDYFRVATNEWEQKKNGYMMKCKAELYNILYSIQNEYFSEYLPNSKLEIIRPAVEYIHTKYASELISIEVLSKMCNITPEYFRKIFKSFYGVSPVIYINNLKIMRAKELLESQMFSVSNVAIQSGYTDISYFSREFKKYTGMTPSEYSKGPRVST